MMLIRLADDNHLREMRGSGRRRNSQGSSKNDVSLIVVSV